MKEELDDYLKESKGEDEVRNKFAGLAAEGRRLTGLSLREAAIEFCTSAGTVSRWENGYSAPPIVSQREVINFYRTRIRQLLDSFGPF